MENKALKALNKELPQFFLEELEQRLETDPLSVGGLFDLHAGDGDGDDCENWSFCKQEGACHDKIHCQGYSFPSN